MSKSNKYRKTKQKVKKSRILIPLLILIVGFAVGVFAYINLTEPAVVVRKYFSLLSEKKYDEMYNLVETDYSKQDFINRIKNIYEGIDAKDISIRITANTKNKEKQDEIDIVYTNKINTIAGNLSFSNTAKVVSKNDKYLIKWNSNLIYPKLDDDEKVRINTITNNRGTIYDRNQNIIAKDGEVYSISIVPEKFDSSNIDNVAKLLNISSSVIRQKLKQNSSCIYLAKISKDKQDTKLELLKIKGILINDSYSRVYPYKEATSILTGYIKDGNGVTGIEEEYNNRLKGSLGYEIYIEKNDKKYDTILKKEKINGEDLKLTIDAELQKKIYNEFEKDKGLVVSLNYNTGEVLALVSIPSYDSNLFSIGLTEEQWEEIQQDKTNPMFNRFLASYAPGSTLKPIIGAIGLTTNSFSANEDFGKSGKKWQKDSTWNDFYITTIEEYKEISNLENALVYSDNIYFAKAALKIGKENLSKYFDKFGFNKQLNLFKNISKSQYGNLDSDKSIASTGFGQGEVLVNPIHLACIYCMFANNGNIVEPYIEYKDIGGRYYLEDATTSKIANEIKNDLIQVIERGTGKSCKIKGKILAGKTGTAEIKTSQNDDSGTENGWFNVFDQNGNLYVSMIEDVKNKNGSHYVVEKMKHILE